MDRNSNIHELTVFVSDKSSQQDQVDSSHYWSMYQIGHPLFYNVSERVVWFNKLQELDFNNRK